MSRSGHFQTFCSIGILAGVTLAIALTARPAAAQTGMQWYMAREQMVARDVVSAGISHPRVVTAMRRTPRHEFVAATARGLAYFDMALPIGEGQTISPPFVVATMTVQLDPQPDDKALEIGTGSGYQAAVLSNVVRDVYTIEIQEPLAHSSAKTLDRLGYKNVHCKMGDGFQGWPEEAPFDKIIVTCSPEKVPQPLVDQLREGGRMVIPLGERYQQVLYLMEKKDGKLVPQAIEPTFFVPMTGTAEQRRDVRPEQGQIVLVNGNFEEKPEIPGIPLGWYYVRQAALASQDHPGPGQQQLLLSNTQPGMASQALQAVGVDGRYTSKLSASLWIRGNDLKAGQSAEDVPQVNVIYFNENRAPIGGNTLGPWKGSFGWRQEIAEWKVPPQARFATVIVSLSGGVGELAIDDFTLSVGAEKVAGKR